MRAPSLEAVAARTFPGCEPVAFLLRRAVEELGAAIRFKEAGEIALGEALASFWREAKSLPAQDAEVETERHLREAERRLSAAARNCKEAREDLGGARFERLVQLMDALSEQRRAAL